MPLIVMQGIGKRYGPVEALTDLDLQVCEGEVVAFLGPNGAGKSTAISIMLGLKRPTRGTVRIFGLDPGRREVRARVGVMLQESGVPESLTVTELVRLFGRYYPYALPVSEVLERADLFAKRGAQVRELSGGQRQRLYFALAVVGDPDLLYLDEPTVGMDVAARRAFWEQVRGFTALGKTVLFSTHYLDEADAFAGRVVVLYQGRRIADGTPAEIKQLVSKKVVRLKVALSADEARRYPGVVRAEDQDGHLVVYSNQPEAFLETLFSAGCRVTDLTVKDTDLEDAFMHLTSRPAGQGEA